MSTCRSIMRPWRPAEAWVYPVARAAGTTPPPRVWGMAVPGGRLAVFALGCLLGVAASVRADPGPLERVYVDPAGDACARPTDRTGGGQWHPDGVLPDVVMLTLSGWQPFAPASDPYAGVAVPSDGADIFRVHLVLEGLANPPGTLGLSGQPFDPYRFGPSPLLGFIELDVDDRKDTGGHLGISAESRFMANVARFGTRPEGSIGERIAETAAEYDQSLYTGAPYERSGADWSLSVCGCSAVTLVSEQGNGNGRLDPGETMIVRGRFFVRAEGYVGASGMRGGSVVGAYDPWVQLRFSHDAATDQTSVTFVGPLTNRGYGMLAGTSTPPVNLRADDGWSIEEGVTDLIESAPFATGQARVLYEDWEGRDVEDSLEPVEWRATALLGTSYTQPDVDGLYVWSDVGFDLVPADLDGDALAGPLDQQALRSWVYAHDGQALDADGIKNGVVTIDQAPYGFALYDLDGDGRVRHEDLEAFGHRADLDGDGMATVFDFLAFQNLFDAGDLRADFDLSQTLDIFDFLAFQNAFDR
ncbi:MAG: hypothetical protein KatS3mg103_0461 [Phycisphaerales bacterium]|nr:MAG: hypothetical protein KatS3mg103_0461 [Phycisphaerales bacterium]